jgi:hypothetical protein
LAIESIVEEAGHRLGHQLIGVRDEAILGATDIFIAKQGAGREVAEISTTASSMRLASAFLFLGPPPFHLCVVG